MILGKHIFYFFLLFTFLKSYSQDIHFSQYNASLLNISPGHTGLFNGDYRLSAIYRSQWQSVPVSYSTINMNGEMRFKPKQLKKDMLGVGLVFNNDRAGDARYGTSQLFLNLNYIFLAKPDSSLIITFGSSLGYSQIGFDYAKMTFDNQYDGFQFNKNISGNENFSFINSNYVDINLGSVIQYTLKNKHKLSYAIGLHHVNTPVISFQGNDQSKLDFKLTHCLGYALPINNSTDLISEILFTSQGKFRELIPHVSLKYYLNAEKNKALLGGLAWRAKDAAIVRVGYNYKTMQSGIAYDINYSQFNAASNKRGGFEIFINYIIKLKPSFIAKKRSCPVFM